MHQSEQSTVASCQEDNLSRTEF